MIYMKKPIDTLSNITPTVQGIHKACSELCNRYGFDQFLYLSKRMDKHSEKLSVIKGSKHAKLTKQAQGILRISKNEPTIQEIDSLLSTLPGDFKDEVLGFLSQSTPEFSFTSSVSFPIKIDNQLLAILIVSSSIQESQITIPETEFTTAHDYALNIHKAAKNLINNDPTSPPVKLTKRELECLQWASMGKTNWEISVILGVSKRTVVFHFQNASQKLNTSNRYHTVAQAVTLGLIKLN